MKYRILIKNNNYKVQFRYLFIFWVTVKYKIHEDSLIIYDRIFPSEKLAKTWIDKDKLKNDKTKNNWRHCDRIIL